MDILRDEQLVMTNGLMTTKILDDTNIKVDETLNIDLLKRYYMEFSNRKMDYIKMKQYYDGIHDIDYNYTKINDRANFRSKRNFIGKFVDNETSYTIANPVNYTSISNDNKVINEIEYSLIHWEKKHDIDLCNTLGVYGDVYELYYIDEITKDFNSLILNPSESYLMVDQYNKPILFFREYSKMFEKKKYIDIYTPDSIYYLDSQFNEIAPSQPNIFGEIPLGFGSIDKTIYDKIKNLQDEYNVCNSDQANLLSDLRFFYLLIYGIDPTDPKNEAMVKNINQNSIMFLNGEAKIDKLEKTINDTFLQNVRNNCKQDMYELAGHINLQEAPTSNTSGEQMITRMQDLTFRCGLLSATIQDVIRQRIRFLFKYLNIKDGIQRNWKDISAKITPNIPKSWTIMANVCSQLKELLSDETLISLLPLDNSPTVEIAKREQEQIQQIEFEKKYGITLPNDYMSNNNGDAAVNG